MNKNDAFPGFDQDTCDFLTIDLQKMKEVDSCMALKLRGQIDTYSAPFFQRSVTKVINAGFIRLILVLDGVEYMSSKAVGAFVQIKKAATDRGGALAMVDIHPKVMEVLKNLSLEKFLCCVDSMEEAVALMKGDTKVVHLDNA